MKITEFIPEQKKYTKAIKEIFDENLKEKIYLLKRIQDEDNHKVLLNIFEIVSDSLEVNESLLKFIDKKTPVHNLFVFRTNEKEEFQYKILLAYKEIYKDDDNKSLVKNIGKYFSTNCLPHKMICICSKHTKTIIYIKHFLIFFNKCIHGF